MLGVGHAICAQIGTDDAVDRFKACSQFDGMERLKCVDELLRKMTETPDSDMSQGPNWIVSETTSPVDYTPQIVAVTKARWSSQDASASLAIRCRALRTELTISTLDSPRRHGEATVAYRINGEPPVEARWKPADNGRSLSFPGDVVRLLRAMPAGGQMFVKVYDGKMSTNESKFELAGLDSVRRMIATTCNWPQPE
jgi:hypothetical protein